MRDAGWHCKQARAGVELWDEACLRATDIPNRIKDSNGNPSPLQQEIELARPGQGGGEMKKEDVETWPPWGCRAVALSPHEKREGKMAAVAQEGVFVGWNRSVSNGMKVAPLAEPEHDGVYVKKPVTKTIIATTVRCHGGFFPLLQRALDNHVRCATETHEMDTKFKEATKPGPKDFNLDHGSKKRKAEGDEGTTKRAKGDVDAYARRWYHPNKVRLMQKKREKEMKERKKARDKFSKTSTTGGKTTQRFGKGSNLFASSSAPTKKKKVNLAKEYFEPNAEDDQVTKDLTKDMDTEEFIGPLDELGPLRRYERCDLLRKILIRRQTLVEEAEDMNAEPERRAGAEPWDKDEDLTTITVSGSPDPESGSDHSRGVASDKEEDSWGSPVPYAEESESRRLFLAAMGPQKPGELKIVLGRQRCFVTELLNTREALATDEGKAGAGKKDS